MFEKDSLGLLQESLALLGQGFDKLPAYEEKPDIERMRQVLYKVAVKMQDNYPYHHPYYIGQMLKPPHPIARLAYMLAMWINPNNHALDGGRASSFMEKEAVAKIAAMFGWDKHLGHLTGGGTMANMEALWVSGKIHPDKKIAASSQAHYTHSRITEVLKIPFVSIPTDKYSRIDVDTLRDLLQTEDIGTVVVTLGTTATGAIDPLPQILDLQKEFDFRIHADCAYGGYFTLADNLGDNGRAAYDCISEVDSIVIDPHKHGLQPYGCGCVLFKDPVVGQFYKHDSPYTYFTTADLHLGEISLECSRAGAAAVGLWATMEMFPIEQGGEFAHGLEQAREAALDIYARLNADARFMVAFEPELDIVIFAPKGATTSEVSALSQAIFDETAKNELHMALTNLPKSLLGAWWDDITWEGDKVTCLRTCLMKPEHLEWMPKIWDVLDKSTDTVLSKV